MPDINTQIELVVGYSNVEIDGRVHHIYIYIVK